MRVVIWCALVLITLVMVMGCEPIVPRVIVTQPIHKETPITTIQATTPLENKDLNNFVNSISNVPAPKGNLKYITQSGNLFEIKLNDGTYLLLNDDYSPLGYCTGHSMLPTFNCNSKIILKRVESKNEVNVGDIIIYEGNDKQIIHRLIKIQNDKYYPRADNWNGILDYINNQLDLLDGSIEFKDIQYKVVGIIY